MNRLENLKDMMARMETREAVLIADANDGHDGWEEELAILQSAMMDVHFAIEGEEHAFGIAPVTYRSVRHK